MHNTDSNFDLSVNDGVYSVDFGATWCQPCKIMKTQLNKLESEFDKIKFMYLDVDDVPELARKYNIKSVPTIIIFKDGSEINRIVGLSLIEPLRRTFKELSSQAAA